MLSSVDVKVIKEKLECVCDTVTYSRKDGTFTARRGYFYRMGNSPEKVAARITSALAPIYSVDVTALSDHIAPFRGGESVARNSHFKVVFKVT